MTITLEKAIQDSGLKKKKISSEVGVTVRTLKNWIDKKTCPDIVQAKKLADMLGIDISDILYFFTHDVDGGETNE